MKFHTALRLSRRQWLARTPVAAAGLLFADRIVAQQKLLPLRTAGLDHLSITVPDAIKAATFYGRIFDPQVFHERTGVQRYYVRLGSAYIAFGPQPNGIPFIDHIAAGVIDLVEADVGSAPMKAELTAAGVTAPQGNGQFALWPDPDNLRLQLVNATHGLFDTLMPGGRVTTDPAALIPIGLDHILISVTDLEKSAEHYRKLFGAEVSREKNPQRVWFKLGEAKLGLTSVATGQKPAYTHFAVKIAGFDRKIATTRLQQLGIKVEDGDQKGSLLFRDLHNLSVEVVSG